MGYLHKWYSGMIILMYPLVNQQFAMDHGPFLLVIYLLYVSLPEGSFCRISIEIFYINILMIRIMIEIHMNHLIIYFEKYHSFYIWQKHHWLVVEPTSLRNVTLSVGIMSIPNWMEQTKTCSKPPTRH